VISSKPNARAYRVRKSGGIIAAEQIPQQDEFTPIECLYKSRDP